MDFAPPINWRLTCRVARTSAGDLPDLTRAEVETLVADLRVTARHAGELAARHLRIDSVGAGTIQVVDWDGWGDAVRRMGGSVFDQLGLPARPDTIANRIRGLGYGAAAGAALGKVSRRLLGQYDAYTGDDTLYLVAPTILEFEQRHRFVPGHFRLWVSLHEQTHALQFRAAPWLRQHLGDGIRAVAEDESHLGEGLIGWARSGDAAALIASEEGREKLKSLTATMTFLEGHADLVADTVGARHANTVATMRKTFSRPKGRMSRLSAILDKEGQYREGLAFCRTVVRRHSWRMLGRALQAPENLPTTAEIGNPQAWINRIRGTS